MDEDSREFGASGRIYDRDCIIEALVASNGTRATAFELGAVRLSPGVVLLNLPDRQPVAPDLDLVTCR